MKTPGVLDYIYRNSDLGIAKVKCDRIWIKQVEGNLMYSHAPSVFDTFFWQLTEKTALPCLNVILFNGIY